MSEHGKAACQNLGGECVTERDGYFIVSALCVCFGILSVLLFLIPTAKKLQGMLTAFRSRTSLMALHSRSYKQVEDILLIGHSGRADLVKVDISYRYLVLSMAFVAIWICYCVFVRTTREGRGSARRLAYHRNV